MPQDGLAGEKGILLGQRAAEAASPSSSDNKSGAGWRHRSFNNIGLALLHFALLRVLLGRANAPAQLLCTAQLAYKLIKE